MSTITSASASTLSFIEYRGQILHFPPEYSHQVMWLIAKNQDVKNVHSLALMYENARIYGCKYENHAQMQLVVGKELP